MGAFELVIGIADIHGHYPALDALLKGLQNEYRIFSDPEALKLRPGVHLVQLGDYIDRGKSNLKVLDACMKLAAANPENIDQLFGNHELMALSCFDDAKEAAGEHNPFQRYRRESVHGYNGGMSFIEEFSQVPRTAFDVYVHRMSREGDIGRWMRSLKPFSVDHLGRDKILFVHGGIPRDLRDKELLEQYMTHFVKHMEVATMEAGGPRRKYLNHPLVGDHSVFWDREIPESNGRNAVQIANALGVDYIVIGHTPQKDIANYEGRIFNIDVGMCPTYGAHEPVAIVFKPEGVFAFYVTRGEELLEFSGRTQRMK